MTESHPPRLIVGITGATGVIFGIRLLEALRTSTLGRSAIETHLIVSKWGAHTLAEETSYTLDRVRQMATYSYPATDQGAAGFEWFVLDVRHGDRAMQRADAGGHRERARG